jgi:tRNA(adenine34) deaminase
MRDHMWHMQSALIEAEKAYHNNEVPVGAIILDDAKKIVAEAHNDKEKSKNPCGHAEILAIQQACKKLNDWRLNDHTLYVTLEPCPMCMGAIIQSRIKKVVFGAYDLKGGALSVGLNIHQNSALNHEVEIIGGIRHFECSKLLSDFFRLKRGEYNKIKF